MPDGSVDHVQFSPRASELAARVRTYNPKSDSALIEAAYAYAQHAHHGQLRQSGEPYFTHPLAVAGMVVNDQLDDATIVTALLHDTVEDTGSTLPEVRRLFGADVADLVNGVTKLTNLQLSSKETKQAENFQKLILATAEDLRVILVKLNDRLHNMRTIKHMIPDKQMQKAQETMDIYAPLAGRMGMQSMREELEDISFRILNPEGRSSVIRRFLKLKTETGDVIDRTVEDIENLLKAAGIDAQVTGREKKPFSIWRKLDAREGAFNRLSDIFGFRIITRTEEDCYRALGLVHRRWTAVPGRFKDYISQPKSNGYRSIHTTVSGRNARRVEIQIRTEEMHEVNETGVAAHWSYRDGIRFENPFAADPVNWLQSLRADLQNAQNPAEVLEHVKLEMFTDQVFCFTPKGRVVKLPRGATPLDFAYAIHTNLGNSCVGAKVDGQRRPLFTRLRNGQSVEIVAAPGQTPQASWADLVVTGRAKTAIRRFAREEERSRQIALGREFARAALDKIGKPFSEKAMTTAAQRLNLDTGDDVLQALGAAEVGAHALLRALYPELVSLDDVVPDPDRPTGVIGLVPGQSATAARCCQPLPGERIVGITWRGRGVEVHAIDCPALVAFEDDPQRWVDLRWGIGVSLGTFTADLEITMANDAGVLGRLCSLIGEHHANITDIRIEDPKPDFYVIALSLEVRDLRHLSRILTAIQADSAVTDVVRKRRSGAESLREATPPPA